MKDLKAAEGVTGSEKGGPKNESKTGPLKNLNFEVFKTTRRDFWGGTGGMRGATGEVRRGKPSDFEDFALEL